MKSSSFDSLVVVLKSNAWLYLDLAIIGWYAFSAVHGLLAYGPYVQSGSTLICPIFCYTAYPNSVLVLAAFMLLVALKHPKAAVPVMLFTVSFGELTFMATWFDPLRPVYMDYARFNLMTALWLMCVVIGPVWLYLQKPRITFHFPRQTVGLLAAWAVSDLGLQWVVPYMHTTPLSVVLASMNLAALFGTVWLVFGL